MQSSTSDLPSLAARVERLEEQNRLFKRGGLALLLSAATLIVMGQARPGRTLEAQNFVLTDSSGIKRAELSAVAGIPWLMFFDAQGKQRSTLFEDAYTLLGPDGRTSAIYIGTNPADATDKEPRIRLQGTDGFVATLGSTDVVTSGTGEQHKTSAASLVLFKKDGKVLWSAP